MNTIKHSFVALGILAFSSFAIADDAVHQYNKPAEFTELHGETDLTLRELIEVAVSLLTLPSPAPPPSLIDEPEAEPMIEYLGDDPERIAIWLESTAMLVSLFSDDNHHPVASSYYKVLAHVEQVLMTLAETDAYSALEIASQSTADESKSQLTHAVLHIWSTYSPSSALAWVTQHDDSALLEQYASTVVYQWLTADPESAIAAVQSLPRNGYTPYFMADYAAHLAQADPLSAYAWAKALPASEDSEVAIQRIANEWAYTDTQSFLDFVDSLSADERGSLISDNSTTIVVQKVQQDPFDALQWAESLDKDDRDLARQVAFTSWFYEHPEAALSHGQQSLEDHEYNQFVESIAYELPAHDLGIAINEFNRGVVSIQNALAYSLVAPMVEDSLDSAVEWINQLPRDNEEHYVHSTAVLGLVQSLVTENPELALHYLLGYQGHNRTDILTEGFWSIALQQRVFAALAVEQEGLTEEDRALFIDILESAGKSDEYHGC